MTREVKTNFTPYKKQEEILNGIINGSYKYNVINSARQCGKSLMINFLAFKYALEINNSVIMVVSPIRSQSKKLYLEIVKSLGDGGTFLVASNNAQDLVINFKNGSTILFVSGEQGDNLRGATVDVMLIDEASYQRPNLWNEILRPMTLIKGKKICFFSTPRGPNHFKDLYDLGLNKEYPDWSSYRILTSENPYINPQEIEAAKKLLPKDVFLSEYMGVFTDSSSGVFDRVTEISTITRFPLKPDLKRRYYGGLDLAIADDYTVLTILDDQGNLVDYLRERQTSWAAIIDQVEEKIKFWNAQTYVELNNIGSVIFEQLRNRCGNKVRPFTTTNKTKNDLIENLKLNIAEGTLCFPTSTLWPDLHIELDMFGYKILPSGKLSYSGLDGAHDDIVISLGLATKMFTDNVGKKRFAMPSMR